MVCAIERLWSKRLEHLSLIPSTSLHASFTMPSFTEWDSSLKKSWVLGTEEMILLSDVSL